MRVPCEWRERPQQWADSARALIKEKTGVTCSFGVAYTQIVARMCSKAAKPNGSLCEL
eukprot:GSA25T00003616001.1